MLTEDFCVLFQEKTLCTQRKGWGAMEVGLAIIMTEKLGCFSLMKNELKHFSALRRSLEDRCLSLLGALCQQEGEGR